MLKTSMVRESESSCDIRVTGFIKMDEPVENTDHKAVGVVPETVKDLP